MPAWLIPVLKAILPNIGTIVSTAAPVFTRKSADAAANQTTLLQQQITELQAAASENDAHIRELAIQMRNAVEAVENGTLLSEKRHRLILLLCIVSLVVSLTSLGASLYILLGH